MLNLLKKSFFTEEESKLIVNAITAAEDKTSGEIRVHIESKCKVDPYERGVEVFAKLNMNKTDLRNGVLFYLAMDDHKFAIVADEGINKVVPAHFWDDIRDLMKEKFAKAEFVNGLCAGITMSGEQLKKHFPVLTKNPNELSNEISIG